MSQFPIIPVPNDAQSPAGRGDPLQGELLFGLPPAQQSQKQVLAMLDTVSFVMDRMFEVPGTKLRVGLNSLLLLLPVFGDGISSLVSAFILAIGLSVIRVPRIIAARMMMNSLIDAAFGWVPVAGDLFNLWFKADTRNVRLLMEYAGRGDGEKYPMWKHWVFVVGMGLLFLLVLAVIVACIAWLVALMIHAFQAPAAALAMPPH